MDYTDIAPQERPTGSETEGDILLFALDRAHWQFAWKTGGLDADQLRRTHPPSTMTLAGLIKHLAFVEDAFTGRASGEPLGPPWDERDWAANGEWGWESAVTDDPEDLYALWYAAIARSRTAWVEMINRDLLGVALDEGDDSYVVNRRRVLVDLIEENLLHTGQASILREAVDGLTGNDPPS